MKDIIFSVDIYVRGFSRCFSFVATDFISISFQEISVIQMMARNILVTLALLFFVFVPCVFSQEGANCIFSTDCVDPSFPYCVCVGIIPGGHFPEPPPMPIFQCEAQPKDGC
eukprot:Phypoly_transcript_18974.p1 GENE.Phypoly_transcript_18974~~Phypoly_transcript_18974.p1  ORF type:complete len:112 (+),score=5.80 Phypoly_transcript_18974:242-577(+)